MNEAELIELLSVYRHKGPMPVLRARSHAAWWLAAAAAALLVLLGGLWSASWRNGWRILRAGETIARPARIERRGIGSVDIAADTVVNFEGGNHFSLRRGTIHAKTIAAPRIFVVDTPRATAVDLGCEYTLTIEPDGSGQLHVTAGWVALDNWSQSLVPRGASATIDARGRLSPPVFDDASKQFKEAIARHDIQTALPLARRRDALTLLNLFKMATPEQRLMIYQRLNELVPAPPGTRPGWIEPWWPDVIRAGGVSAIKKKVSSRR